MGRNSSESETRRNGVVVSVEVKSRSSSKLRGDVIEAVAPASRDLWRWWLEKRPFLLGRAIILAVAIGPRDVIGQSFWSSELLFFLHPI
jgi:hypothetical protein